MGPKEDKVFYGRLPVSSLPKILVKTEAATAVRPVQEPLKLTEQCQLHCVHLFLTELDDLFPPAFTL